SSSAAGEPCLVGIPSREIDRVCGSDYICVAPAIHSDSSKKVKHTAPIVAAAPQVGGVFQDGINNQGLAGVVLGYLKSNLILSLEYIMAINSRSLTLSFRGWIFGLIDDGLMEANHFTLHIHHQVALTIDLQAVRTLDA